MDWAYVSTSSPSVLFRQLEPFFKPLHVPSSLSLSSGSSSQNGSALRRELSGGSYGSKRQTMTSPSESSLSSGGGMDCGDAPLSQFDREVSKHCESEHTASCINNDAKLRAHLIVV